jgi:hypothetical protein
MQNQSISDLIAQLNQAISNLVSTVDQFPTEKREQQLFDRWSLKDILAHFSGWNLLTVKELTMLQNGQVVDRWTGGDDMDAFNAAEVEKRKHFSWDEAYIEFVDSMQQLLNKYKELTPQQWASRFGPEPQDTPVRSINIDIEHIGEIHLDDIKKFLNHDTTT